LPPIRVHDRHAAAGRGAGVEDHRGKGVRRRDQRRATPTPEFYIARYPVTVAQFRAFVEATGFAIGDADALADPDSRPVRWVSWHEALAWCDWLNEVLTSAPAFAGSPVARLVREHGWRVALPSELEWEKAARGGLSGAVFPWGDDADPNRGNYDDSKIGDTSAVGCFAANDFGLCTTWPATSGNGRAASTWIIRTILPTRNARI
jgi:formylglycine-generating enzyme required for sulfatase activity